MFDWFFSLDATVQVALIGMLGGIGAGAFGLFKTLTAPKTEEHEKEYGPKPTLISLSDKDRAIFEGLTKTIDNHADAIERHRNDLDKLH